MTLIWFFLITIAQNASFTLVSRARNSGSLLYNGLASILSNGIWFFVVKQVVDNNYPVWQSASVYISAATIGSVLMQWVAIRFLEKKRVVK